MALTLAIARLIRLTGPSGTIQLSDHNRDGLDVSVERIETSTRMANGTLRKYHVADKRTFSTSWSMLPSKAEFTVDGHAGSNEIEAFYDATKGIIDMRLTYGNSPETLHRVMFQDFSKNLNKRGRFDFYDVDISLEEV